MLFDIGICILASLWRSTVNVGSNVILKDIDKSKTAELNSGKRREVVHHDIWSVPLNQIGLNTESYSFYTVRHADT